MIVTIGDRQYRVRWEHGVWPGGITIGLYGRTMTICGETRCRIGRGDCCWAFATAYCSVKDQFTKERGRKLSLKRALEKGGFTKSERTAFWRAYHGRRNGVAK